MTNQKILWVSSMFCMFIQFVSCIKPSSSVDPRDGETVYSGCRIKKITWNAADAKMLPYTRQITYNKNNDPVTVTASEALGTRHRVF